MHALPPLTADNIPAHTPRRGTAVTRWLGRCLLRALRLRVVGHVPDAPQLVVVGAPHTSNWDGAMAIGVALALSIDVRVIAKKEMFRWPFAGLLTWMGVIGIDRRNPAGIVGEVDKLFNEREQLYLCIAPEGTRGGAETWKSGFHRMARTAGVPIMVLVFDWGGREIRFADHFEPSEDYQADLTRILGNFHGVQARVPAKLSVPLQELSKDRVG